jgi:hypothetical protein
VFVSTKHQSLWLPPTQSKGHSFCALQISKHGCLEHLPFTIVFGSVGTHVLSMQFSEHEMALQKENKIIKQTNLM